MGGDGGGGANENSSTNGHIETGRWDLRIVSVLLIAGALLLLSPASLRAVTVTLYVLSE